MCGSPSLIEIDCSAATLEIVLCLTATFDPFTLESLENCVCTSAYIWKNPTTLCVVRRDSAKEMVLVVVAVCCCDTLVHGHSPSSSLGGSVASSLR